MMLMIAIDDGKNDASVGMITKDFRLGKFTLPRHQPQVMGILNITPDSFYDGGKWYKPDEALHHAEEMVSAGADIIDVGGESTRPGAKPVTEEQEIDRVLGVVTELTKRFDVPISIDTSKPKLMSLAAAAGVGLINDVRALQMPGALEAAAASQLPVCLMHMQGEPQAMQQDPYYADVVKEVYAFLDSRVETCIAAGISKERIIVDPGFGFGKTFHHNLSLWRHLADFTALGCPVLVGLSNKSFLRAIVNRPSQDCLVASAMSAMLAARRGAWILRVHDVAATVDALKVASLLADHPSWFSDAG